MKKIFIFLSLILANTMLIHANDRAVAYEMWTIMFHKDMQSRLLHNDHFRIELAPVDAAPKQGALHLPAIFVQPKLRNLRPNRSYVIYCPNTGCPEQPELLLAVHTDQSGNPVESTTKQGKLIPQTYVISLYAIPGFRSDWYLFDNEDASQNLFTSFVYKPVIARGSQGQQLKIQKRESGGNLMEIILTGFEPGETVQYISTSEDEELKRTLTMNAHGAVSFVEAPAVMGKTKGIVTIRIIGSETLQASCNWDTTTLSVPRKQPLSAIAEAAFKEKFLGSAQQ